MQGASFMFGNVQIHLSEKNVDFNFSEIGPAHLHVAPLLHAYMVHSALQSRGADRAHAQAVSD